MVFSSMHPYLDPANWPQQQQPSRQIGNSSGPGSQLLPPPPPPLPPSQSHGASGSGSIRPGSMADRARMANIPMPEAALKCPRCDSTNTKFCYFNNYSLSQPRHFCKTCRRYWTRGGALRNVPVGGGCRRNKRSKGSSSKSPPVSSDRQAGSATSNNSVSSNSASAADMVGLSPQLPSSLRFSAPTLHQLTEFGSGEMGLSNYGLSNQMGGVGDLSFHIGTALAGGASGSGSSILSPAGLEQWRMSQTQQFPFLTGLEASPDLYQFQSGAAGPGYGGGASQLRPKVPSGLITQLASVKMEDRHNHRQELNLSSHFLGMNSNSTNHEQYWNTAAGNSNTTNSNWTELSGFRSSSTTSNNPP